LSLHCADQTREQGGLIGLGLGAGSEKMNGCDKNRRDNNNPDLRKKVLKKSKTKERSLKPPQCLANPATYLHNILR